MGVCGGDRLVFFIELKGKDFRVLENFGSKRSGVAKKNVVEFRPNDVPCSVIVSQSDEVCVWIAFLLASVFQHPEQAQTHTLPSYTD